MALAYLMTWVDKDTGKVRLTLDCGINKAHAEAGTRSLLPSLRLAQSQFLGVVSGPDEMVEKWGKTYFPDLP